MRLAVAGNDVAGLSLALRLRIKGHDVVVHDTGIRTPIDEQFTVIAPFRDLFLKSGGALDDLIGLHEVIEPLQVQSGSNTLSLPAVGAQVPAISRALGTTAGQQWSRLLSDAAETWQAVRTGHFKPRSSLHAYLRQHIPDKRLHDVLYALTSFEHPKHISDAAIITPYLRQTFGVWKFDGGISALEAVLRDRCTGLGITVSSAPRPVDALTVDDYFAAMFTAPPRFLHRPVLTTPVTQRLGLPFIGMAAEGIANRIGRATAQ